MAKKNDIKNVTKMYASSNSNKKNSSTKASTNKNYWGKNYNKNPNKQTSSSSASKKASNSLNKEVNKVISESVARSNLSNTQSSIVTKQVKRLPLASKICIILLFVIGFAISIGACYLICRNDQFEIVGKKNITLNIDDSYSDYGVKAICFGLDSKNQVKVEVYKNGTLLTNGLQDITTSEEATYEILYKLNNFRFRDVKIKRTVNVISVEDIPPEEDALNETTFFSNNYILNI